MTEKKKDPNIDEDGWPITAERYVAFIDIVGFKDMIARKPHNEIYEMMDIMNSKITFVTKDLWKIGNHASPIRTISYSDSIMIYSQDASEDSYLIMEASVSKITDYLLMSSIPHKGAMSFGFTTTDKNKSIYFGQPIIDAYLLQEELKFYGIVLHSTIEGKIKGNKHSYATNYLCPFKNGVSSHLCILPTTIQHTNYIKRPTRIVTKALDKIFDCVDKFREMTSGYLRTYVDNTEAFLKAVSKH